MGIRMIVIGGALAIAVAVVVVTGLVVVQYGGSRSTSEPAAVDVLVESQRLRSQNESLVRRNARLTTENENLQARVNELQVEGAGQGNLALELERLRGELERARRDLVEESATREQLEETLADRRVELARRDSSGGFGWLAFLLVALLVLAGLALWRELWWWRRSNVLTTAPPMRVVGDSTNAVTRRTTDVASTRPRG